MKLAAMSNREQALAAAVIVVLLLGIYGFLRFMPATKAIVDLQHKAEATQKKVISTRIPEAPEYDMDELLEQLDDQEQALALLRSSAETVEQKLAPFESQELKVRISELARSSDVRIRINERLAVVAQNTPQPVKQSKKRKAKEQVPTGDLVLPATMNWLARMSPGTMFHRPMQRLEIDGNYESLRRFIHGLNALPWQVTVVRLKLEKMPTSPPHGYAQILNAELVLAL
ncbi:hypothetical protein [Methylophaga sp. OBS4]|uniref:hypothetical protein n=1 Tax=Methylophaga sp. OBS4 TaxID=2991935 RepID=UPI0022573AD8|nr:hypothetical protein [Methylophaga sp. OBS4]MCX4187783.1 hypothetical protein [Methylophaga sp. OBS4]